MLAVGAFLASLGVIRGSGEDKDAYETYLKQTGESKYSLCFGDVSINISQIAPAAIPLFMGVELYNAVHDSDGVTFESIVDMLSSCINPMMEMSFMSSLNDALNNYNADDGIGGNIGAFFSTAAQNYAGQYVPTILNKVARATEKTKVTAKSSAASKVGSTADYWWRSMVKKIPGASSALEPDTDVYGQTYDKDTFGDWALGFANAFVLPTEVTVKNRDKVDNEVIRLYESTGDVDIIPTMPRKYFVVDGKQYNMTAKQYTEFTRLRGKAVYASIKELFASAKYINASNAEKAALLSHVISRSEESAATQFKDDLGLFD